MKKCAILSLVAVLFVLLLVQGVALIRCEVLTSRYFSDFAGAWSENRMLDEMEYGKVLSCDGMRAEVYYVEKEYTAAYVLILEKQNGAWKEASWNVVWTTHGGSASEVVWPYWWHFIYGGL